MSDISKDFREQTPKIIPSTPLFLVHGYNVEDGGADTVDTMLPALRDLVYKQVPLAIHQFDYGWTGLSTIIKYNDTFAKELANLVKSTYNHTGFAIGHSNGCAIICEAARKGAKFQRVLLINPALPVTYEFSENLGEVLVIYTKHDIATRAARWGNRIPFLRHYIPSAWGAMGAKGSLHAHFNYDMSEYVDGHSDLFSEHNSMWRYFFTRQLLISASYYERQRQLYDRKYFETSLEEIGNAESPTVGESNE